MREMSCPLKKSWKLRWRRARRVAGSAIVRDAEAFRAWSSDVGRLLKGESFECFLVLLDFLVAPASCRLSRDMPSLVGAARPHDSRRDGGATFAVQLC